MMSYLLEFEIETPTTIKNTKGKLSGSKNFPFLNRLMVQSPLTRNACKKHWEKLILTELAKHQKPTKPLTGWYAEYTWFVPFTMDADNVSAGTKHINDALVKAGVLIDDSLSVMGKSVVRGDLFAQAIAPIHRFVKSSSREKRVFVRVSDHPFYELKKL